MTGNLTELSSRQTFCSVVVAEQILTSPRLLVSAKSVVAAQLNMQMKEREIEISKSEHSLFPLNA